MKSYVVLLSIVIAVNLCVSCVARVIKEPVESELAQEEEEEETNNSAGLELDEQDKGISSQEVEIDNSQQEENQGDKTVLVESEDDDKERLKRYSPDPIEVIDSSAIEESPEEKKIDEQTTTEDQFEEEILSDDK